MTKELTQLDRMRGCLLAGAVGDALGAPVEFMRWPEIENRYGPEGITDYVEYGDRGAFTDDTQMTLFTAEGIIRAIHRADTRGICHPPSVVRLAMLRWLVTQGAAGDLSPEQRRWIMSGTLVQDERLHCLRAPGNSRLGGLKAQLRALESGEEPPKPISDSYGCGGVMRVAPVGLSGHDDPYGLGVECAAQTHGHVLGQQPAGLLAEMIASLMQGARMETAARDSLERHRADLDPKMVELMEKALALAAHEAGPDHRDCITELGEGWVGHEALAISLYCALVARDLREGLLLAVNHSGDTDSTGSITGNLLGTLFGVDAIPPGWIERLDASDLVDRIAHDLCSAVADRRFDREAYPPG